MSEAVRGSWARNVELSGPPSMHWTRDRSLPWLSLAVSQILGNPLDHSLFLALSWLVVRIHCGGVRVRLFRNVGHRCLLRGCMPLRITWYARWYARCVVGEDCDSSNVRSAREFGSTSSCTSDVQAVWIADGTTSVESSLPPI